jgi:leucyl-tRNA synthetase
VDAGALTQDTIEWVLQVNGKVRGRVELPAGIEQDAAREAALANENVQRFLEGRPVRKVILVPGKLVNVVVG